jgi:Flp pilus assembly pilin Flp
MLQKAARSIPRLRQAAPIREESGATMLEWALLLGVIAIPGYWIIKAALVTLVGHYQMMTTVNGMPFP